MAATAPVVTTMAARIMLLAALTSCSADGNNTMQSGTSTPGSTASITVPTNTTMSQAEVAAKAASAVVEDYYATVDHLSQRAEAPLSKLSMVATSVQLSAERALLEAQRDRGERQVGDTEVAQLTVQSVNLDNSDPKAGKVPTVQLDVCWNVSKVDVVDATGQSVVSPSRPNSGWTRLTVANYHYVADPTGGWRVATGEDLKRPSCVAP